MTWQALARVRAKEKREVADAIRKEVGGAIREMRIERGLTMTRLANLIGVSVPYISDVERGAKGMRDIARFAGAFGLRFDAFPRACPHCGHIQSHVSQPTPRGGSDRG